jgi:hypothetical protein
MIELLVVLAYLVSGMLIWRQLYKWKYKDTQHAADALDRLMGVLTTFAFPLVLLTIGVIESGPIWKAARAATDRVLIPKTQYELDWEAEKERLERLYTTAQLDHEMMLGPEYDIHDDQEVADACSICKELARKERDERTIQEETKSRNERMKKQKELTALRSGQADKIIAQLTTMNPQLDQAQLDAIRRNILNGGRSPEWYIDRFGKQNPDKETIYSYESHEPIKTLNGWEY